MDRGIYAATSAGLFQLRKLEIVNNNLANINTPGFKREVLTGEEQTFDQTLASLTARSDPYAKGDHERTSGVTNISAFTDFTAGPIKNTENPLDVALRNANDFFAISTPSGIQYTRAGNFSLSSSGDLVTMDGMPVQGDGGNINVSGPGAEISQDGSVRVNGASVGRLTVVRIEDPKSLLRAGDNRFSLASGAGQPPGVEPDLVPRSLEMSNVSAISSVVDLITTNKAFQMYAKSTETIDTMNQAAINQIGRPRG